MTNILHNWRKTLNQGEKHLIMTHEQLDQANKLRIQIVRLRDNVKKLKQGLEYYQESSLQKHLVGAYACKFYVSTEDIIKSITYDINDMDKRLEQLENELENL